MRTALHVAVTQQAVAEEATNMMLDALSAAREDGASWAEIGEALGMNRSTARSTLAPKIDARRASLVSAALEVASDVEGQAHTIVGQ